MVDEKAIESSMVAVVAVCSCCGHLGLINFFRGYIPIGGVRALSLAIRKDGTLYAKLNEG